MTGTGEGKRRNWEKDRRWGEKELGEGQEMGREGTGRGQEMGREGTGRGTGDKDGAEGRDRESRERNRI